MAQKAQQTPPKTVALALGSGGARGYAHIGFIRALEEHNYKIVKIAGSSMGAIVGSMYCAGKLDEFEAWVRTLKQFDVIKLLDLTPLSSGVIRGDKIFNTLANFIQDTHIEDLNIPFTAVATDLISRKEVWFQTGSVLQAVRASSAIPSVFTPVRMGKRYLIDGGAVNPVPIIPCASANAEHVFAVDLNGEMPVPDSVPTSSNAIDALLQQAPTAANDATELPKASPKKRPKKKQKNKDKAKAKAEQENSRFKWFDDMTNKATGWLEDKSLFNKDDLSQEQAQGITTLGKLEILNQVVEIMQVSIGQYKTAGYPPDMLVKIPAEICQSYEFYHAQEVIELGYQIGKQTLLAYAEGNSSTYGQLW